MRRQTWFLFLIAFKELACKQCTPNPRIVSETGKRTNYEAYKVLTEGIRRHGWFPRDSNTGADAEFVIDLGCRTKLEYLVLRNGEVLPDGRVRGVHQFAVWTSDGESGPWELALEKYFPPKQGHVHLADEILYGWTVEARFARYIRFQCLQYLHSGCSLKYFSFSSLTTKNLNQMPI